MKNSESTIKVIIAAHKKYRMPTDDIYLPLHVGAEEKIDENGEVLELGYIKDNSGGNISYLNSSFCELTGLYWAWKNLDSDYIGLVHYRRHFSYKKKGKDSFENILSSSEARSLCKKYKVIVPKKRKYYIETLYSHYSHTHYGEQLDTVRDILKSRYPQYLQSFDKVMHRRWGYMFNMMIMERKLLDKYCLWIFDILFQLKKSIVVPELSFYQGRFYGRISELCFNVWLDYQIKNRYISKNDIKELPYIYTEKIDWWKKGTSFLKAKFFKKKYEVSF